MYVSAHLHHITSIGRTKIEKKVISIYFQWVILKVLFADRLMTGETHETENIENDEKYRINYKFKALTIFIRKRQMSHPYWL